MANNLYFEVKADFLKTPLDAKLFKKDKQMILLVEPQDIEQAEKIDIKSQLREIQLRKIDAFEALALRYTKQTCIATPKMFSLAVSDITLQEVVESIAGIDIPRNTILNEISIQGINMPDKKERVTPAEVETRLSEWGNKLRKMVEGKGNGAESDFTYTLRENNRISIMDKAYMRHYALIPDGNSYIPQVEAQFILAKEDIQLGEYHVSRGAFVCANIRILGAQVVTFLNMSDNDVTACMMIAPIRKAGVLEITGTRDSIAKAPLMNPPAIVNSIINLSKKEQGAICYFSASKGKGVNLYLDAHINLLSVIVINANIQMSKGMVRIDTSGVLLSVFKYVLSIECTYRDFDNASFSILLAIDTSALKEKFKKVQKKIQEAKRAVSANKDGVYKKFEEAKRKVDGLQSQINSFNRQIADKRNARSHAGFFKKIKYAFQIAGLEIAKAAVVCAMGIAKAALSIAQKVANAPFTIANLALDMVNAILEGAMNLFYIERFVIMATVGAKNGFLFDMDFVLFGRKHAIQYKVDALSEDQGDTILNDLDDQMSQKAELNAKEMPQLDIPEHLDELDFNLEHLAESLEAGKISVNSAHDIIRNTEMLYAKYIDSEMDFAEKDELETAFIQNSLMIKEYTDLSDKMNKSALEALNILNIPEKNMNLQAKSGDGNILEDLLEEKNNLLNTLQNIQDQNEVLKKTLDDTAKDIKLSKTIARKGHGEQIRVNADWNSFASDMEDMLVEEADKSIGNHYIVPGYEPAVIDAVRDFGTLVKKSNVKAREGYTNRIYVEH